MFAGVNEEKSISFIAIMVMNYTIHFLLMAVLLFFAVYGNNFPYSDEWIYVDALRLHDFREFFNWLFAQHVDHRIPLQKSIQLLVALIFEYDFRFLVILNTFVAGISSIVLVLAAQMVRGNKSIGDIIIPLIFLSPSLGYNIWSFQLQFLSSIFFASILLYLFVLLDKKKSTAVLLAIAGLLILCSLCGMNGLIFSSGISFSVIFYIIYILKTTRKTRGGLGAINTVLADVDCLYYVAPVICCLLLNCVIIFFWMPSNSSTQNYDIKLIAEFIFYLIPSSLSYYAQHEISEKSIIIGLSAVYASYLFLINLSELPRYKISDFIVFGFIITTLAILTSIAFGRSGATGNWNNGFVNHYGLLTVFLPVCSWIIISKFEKKSIKHIAPLLFIFFYGAGYYSNLIWRNNNIHGAVYSSCHLVTSLKKERDLEKFVENNISALNWQSDDLSYKQKIVNNLKELRSRNYRLYAFQGD